MSSVIVLLELEASTEVIDSAEVDIGARARWVHAARTDPDAPGDVVADRRPVPEAVRRHFAVYDYGRAFRPRCVPYFSHRAERRGRQDLRAVATCARGLHRAGHDDDFIVEPVRHRHGALWDAW
jgi:hypothetical protein